MESGPPQPATGEARRVAPLHSEAKTRILRAAARLFVGQGYARTTVRDLARAVGIQSGSLFHHFQSKEEILVVVMAEVIERNLERMHSAIATTRSPIERLRALIRCELESIHGDTGDAMSLLVREWQSLSPSSQARVLELRDRYERIWLESLAAAQSELLPIEPFILRRLLVGAIMNTATWYRRDGTLSLDQLSSHVLALALESRQARLELAR